MPPRQRLFLTLTLVAVLTLIISRQITSPHANTLTEATDNSFTDTSMSESTAQSPDLSSPEVTGRSIPEPTETITPPTPEEETSASVHESAPQKKSPVTLNTSVPNSPSPTPYIPFNITPLLTNDDVRAALLPPTEKEQKIKELRQRMIEHAKSYANKKTSVLDIKGWPKWARLDSGAVKPELSRVGCSATQSQILKDTGVLQDCYPLVSNLYRTLLNDEQGLPIGMQVNPRPIPLSQLKNLEKDGALQPGDLLFFLGGARFGPHGHVGMYIGDGRIIDTSSQAGQVVNRLATSILATYKKVDIVRIINPPTQSLLNK